LGGNETIDDVEDKEDRKPIERGNSWRKQVTRLQSVARHNFAVSMKDKGKEDAS